MLMSESLEIGDMFRDAMRDRYGETELPSRYHELSRVSKIWEALQCAALAYAGHDQGRR